MLLKVGSGMERYHVFCMVLHKEVLLSLSKMSGQDMLWGKLRTEVNYLSGLLGFQNQAISRSDYAIAVFF